MKEQDADKLTKYFREGVRAHIWCYDGSGSWAISIHRDDGHILFLGLDQLKRCVLRLRTGMSPPGSLVLWTSEDSEVQFSDIAAASACITALGEAVAYVQSQTLDLVWHDVPPGIFEPIASNETNKP